MGATLMLSQPVRLTGAQSEQATLDEGARTKWKSATVERNHLALREQRWHDESRYPSIIIQLMCSAGNEASRVRRFVIFAWFKLRFSGSVLSNVGIMRTVGTRHLRNAAAATSFMSLFCAGAV